ncbi:hypothetical protein Cme02nite_54940 [Catellatospora methionotrophica]|uniref:non-specific serine/threonine protein kinase n=1 Tax=Catellatospora methionotrophica TaxID=121620 RepID=A0A8J3PHB9_9ACTN|nr:serine/threonine-protein kinase [Catellatospora methionotrophica]GIG17162.1 hypothetical protein Cme02nite_54940 [Catellatospora methionotrophica]
MSATPPPPQLPGFAYVGPVDGGDGGYAKVFRYEQQSPRRMVAVKVLRVQGIGEAHYQAMLDEATAMAVLETHPHMVPVFEAKMSTDGQPCIIMMYCGGPNLLTLVTDRDSPSGRPRLLGVRRVIRLGIQIAGVVQAAHDKGIVHRDIKPANILTDDRGSPRLTDFGIAGRLDGADDDQQFGLSLPWCPPEILAGRPATAASDTFSLGATLWHLLVGRSPFDVPGRNSQAELEARIADPCPAPLGRSDVPPQLEQLLARMMAKAPSARPRTAAEVAVALTAIEQRIGAPRPDEPWHTGDPRPMTPSVTPELVRTAGRATPSPPLRAVPVPPAGSPPEDPIAILVPVATELKRRERQPDPIPAAPAAPAASRTARWAWLAGVAIVAVAAAGLLLVDRDPTPPTTPAAVDETTGGADGGGAGSQGDSLPPGKPEITAVRVDDRTLRFTWTYSAPLDSDTYLWRVVASEQSKPVTEPAVDVPSPRGTEVCIVVKVVRADGSNGTVAWSDQGCGS